MGQLKELLNNTATHDGVAHIAQLDAYPGANTAHHALHEAANDLGIPVRTISGLAIAETVADNATEASVVTALAEQLKRSKITAVVSPAGLSSLPEHEIAGRVVARAAALAVTNTGGSIDVLVAHGRSGPQGPWIVDTLPKTIDGGMGAIEGQSNGEQEGFAATSYTRRRYNPGVMLSEGPSEAFFGMSSQD